MVIMITGKGGNDCEDIEPHINDISTIDTLSYISVYLFVHVYGSRFVVQVVNYMHILLLKKLYIILVNIICFHFKIIFLHLMKIHKAIEVVLFLKNLIS
jgi:hypothetical protein